MTREEIELVEKGVGLAQLCVSVFNGGDPETMARALILLHSQSLRYKEALVQIEGTTLANCFDFACEDCPACIAREALKHD